MFLRSRGIAFALLAQQAINEMAKYASGFDAAKALFAKLGIQLDARCAEASVQEIDDILAKALQMGDEVSALENVKSRMVEQKLATYKPVQPGRAGVSQKNRSRLGVVGSVSQLLGKDVLFGG